MALDGSDLAVLIPLWRRVANIERVYASIRATTPAATVCFVVSEDDAVVIAALGYLDEVNLANGRSSFREVTVPGAGGERGDYARKVNAGYRATDEPVLFTGADDLIFHDGWYEAARAVLDVPDLAVVFRDEQSVMIGPSRVPRIGVVGTNDLANARTMNGAHSTHSLVARWYAQQGCSADQGDMIYHEGYWHEFCDDEMVQTAMARGAYLHAYGAHVEHVHPIVGPHAGSVADDEVYRHGRAHSRESRMLYRRRQWLWRGSTAQQRMLGSE